MTDARVERAHQLDHPRCPTDLAFRRGLTAPQKYAFAPLTCRGGRREAAEKAVACEKLLSAAARLPLLSRCVDHAPGRSGCRPGLARRSF